MTIEVQESVATQPSSTEKAEPRMPFAGEYFADEKGRITFTVTFPAEALQHEKFKPVQAMVHLANMCELKGYGKDDAPQATVSTERAHLKGGADNPKAGTPTGNISLVLHTAETLANAAKRGRAGVPKEVRDTLTAVSKLLQQTLLDPSNLKSVQDIMTRQERGELSTKEAIDAISAL